MNPSMSNTNDDEFVSFCCIQLSPACVLVVFAMATRLRDVSLTKFLLQQLIGGENSVQINENVNRNQISAGQKKRRDEKK